jgi:hypothetical protein
MTAKTTNRRTAISGFLASKAVERLLIVAAVAAVLVAFGAWFAMGRPADADAADATRSTATAGTAAATAAEAAATEEPAAAPSSVAEAPAAPAEEDAATGSTAPAPAPATEAPAPTPETFLDEVTDSGLAPPVDDAQKLAMARDVCAEMGHGATPDDMVRALTFAGASDEEAANFVQLAVTNICPEHAA